MASGQPAVRPWVGDWLGAAKPTIKIWTGLHTAAGESGRLRLARERFQVDTIVALGPIDRKPAH